MKELFRNQKTCPTWRLGLAVLAMTAAPIGFTLAAQAATPIGINIGNVNSRDKAFADAMKSRRPFWGTVTDFGSADGPVGPDGWPSGDASVMVWEGQSDNDGTYRLKFNGKATVTAAYNYGVVSPSYIENGVTFSGTYDTASNTTTATVVVAGSGSQNFSLIFRNTKRTAASASNTGITNVRLFRPVAKGSSTPIAETETFTPPFKAMVSKFAAVRFLDFQSINSNQVSNWADRTLPSQVQTRTFGNDGINARDEAAGGALEYAVKLCNETQKDMWIHVPHLATGSSPSDTSSFVYKMAQLIRYGSDGVNPYSSTQTNPVFAPLNSNLKVYIEFSNEVWNTAFGFSQTNKNYALATQEVNAGGSPLNYDGETNDWTWARRRVAKRALEISTIFRAVFGDSAMMTRVRPVLMWQVNQGQGTPGLMLPFLDRYYNNGDGVQHVANPHPVNYYFWAGGAANYADLVNDTAPTVDERYNSGLETTLAARWGIDAAWAKGFGMNYANYEGGFKVGRDSEGALDLESNLDPRSKDMDIAVHGIVEGAGTSLSMIYNSAAGNYARVYPNTYNTEPNRGINTPRMQAITQLNNSPAAPITNGVAISNSTTTTIPAASSSARGGTGVPVRTVFSDNAYTIFLMRVSTAGSYNIVLQTKSTGTGGQLRCLMDGVNLGSVLTLPQSSTAVNLNVGTKALSAGLHGFLIKGVTAASGTTRAGEIVNILVNPVSTPPSSSIIADSYVRDGSFATTNYGTSTQVISKKDAAGANRQIYLRFGLSGSASISSAKVRLYGKHNSTTGTAADSIYKVTDNAWSETGINWNNKPAYDGLNDKLATTVVATGTQSYYEWDVTSYVQERLNAGATAISFALTMDSLPSTGQYNVFNSREASSNPPQLVISTGVSGATISPNTATSASSPSGLSAKSGVALRPKAG